MFNLDWGTMFIPHVPLLETILRGTVVYISIYILLRVVLKREAGTISISDLLVITLLADAAQNAMASDYKSITDGLLLVSVIIFWSFALDWLGFHSKFFQKLLKNPPLLLVKDGQMIRRNMRKEFITDEELTTALHQQGLEDLKKVKKAFIEPNGRISIITGQQEESGDEKQDHVG